MKNRLKLRLGLILLSPCLMILNILVKAHPRLVEKYYSNGINKIMREALSLFTGNLPFSAAEFLFFILLGFLIFMFMSLAANIRKGKFLNKLINICSYISVLYVLFIVLWGFNYNRLPFDKIAGYTVEKYSNKDLKEMCESLIERANSLRKKVTENSHGVMAVPGGYHDVFNRAQKGYDIISKTYSELAGSYGIPKRILLSNKMSYTGITGIYAPYTGEANVNVNITDLSLPSTVTHEMAHQRGFAREDEANYIGYLACINNVDIDFQYSGVMLGLIYSMNALAENDREAFKTLKDKYSDGVKQDLIYESQFWEKYKGKAEEISDKINNSYLKSNGQKDGVKSYGRMVDLLLAEYKSKFPR